jgi:hypothetical protein
MKKLILGVILIILTTLIGSEAEAHYIVPFAYCSANHTMTMEMDDWSVGKGYSAYIYATKDGSQSITHTNPVVWSLTINLSKKTSYGLNDSVGAIGDAEFKINVPSYITNLYGTENDSYGNTVWASGLYHYNQHGIIDQCLALPINLLSFTGTYQALNKIEFDWTLSMEQNVSYYEVLQLMPDNSERMVAHYDSYGDTQIQRTYTSTVYYATGNVNGSLQAGIASGLVIMFIIGLLLSLGKNRKVFMSMATMLIFTLGTISCTKTEQKIPLDINAKSGIFRLKEVDKDGTINYFQYIQVYINN